LRKPLAAVLRAGFSETVGSVIANSFGAVAEQPESEFVIYRSLFKVTIPVVFLFTPVSKAQTVPNAPDAHAVSFEANENKAVIGSIPPDPPVKKSGVYGNEVPPVRFRKRQFLALSAGVYAAGLADMYQTRRYSWWYEKDPLAKPMVRLPAPAYYATGLALATGLNWLSWKMGHSRKWHRLAPLPQLLAISGNTYGFKSNRFQNYQ
jgi:hypothetical protein